MRKLTASILLTICAIAAAQTSAFKRTILAKEEISLAGREAVVVRVEIPATGSVGRHTHYGEEAGYIESGEVEMLIDGAAPRRIKAGDDLLP